MRVLAAMPSGSINPIGASDIVTQHFGEIEGVRTIECNVSTTLSRPFDPYSAPNATSRPPFGLILQASVDRDSSVGELARAMAQLADREAHEIALYDVEEDEVFCRAGFRRGRPTPGIKIMRGIWFHDDLSPAAASRLWRHHRPLAVNVHVGLARYACLAVRSKLSEAGPNVDGFTVLHFPNEVAMRERYFDSERGRDEITHDTGHFIASGTERMYFQEFASN